MEHGSNQAGDPTRAGNSPERLSAQEPTFGYQRSPLTVLIDPSRRSQSGPGQSVEPVPRMDPGPSRHRPGKVAVIATGVIALALLGPGGYAIGRFSANYSRSIGASSFVQPPQSGKLGAAHSSLTPSARPSPSLAPSSTPPAVSTTATATGGPTNCSTPTPTSAATSLTVTHAQFCAALDRRWGQTSTILGAASSPNRINALVPQLQTTARELAAGAPKSLAADVVIANRSTTAGIAVIQAAHGKLEANDIDELMGVLTTAKVISAENDFSIYSGQHCGPNA